MTYSYSDPDGGTAEQVVTWEIQEGYQGRWSTSKTFEDRAKADEWLQRRRKNCPSQNLRLVQVETTTVRTVEP